MFERFFRKKIEGQKENVEQKYQPKFLVPEFQEDPEMESVIKEYIEILRARFGYMHDGMMEEVNEADAKAKTIEDKYGEKMRAYLRPYIEIGIEKIPAYNVPKSEHNRWQTASTLKAVDKRSKKQNKS
ncbi:MAG TPA: hypothetical protein VI998_01840 [Patescibacteria group bacterium]|nr:hypothetical protein [Patescibacteria group bacterium]